MSLTLRINPAKWVCSNKRNFQNTKQKIGRKVPTNCLGNYNGMQQRGGARWRRIKICVCIIIISWESFKIKLFTQYVYNIYHGFILDTTSSISSFISSKGEEEYFKNDTETSYKLTQDEREQSYAKDNHEA